MTERTAVLTRPTHETAFLQALDAATTKFKPTPYKRSAPKEFSGEETDDIIDTVTALGDEYTKRLFNLNDTQSAVFIHAYRQGLQEQSSHKEHSGQLTSTDHSAVHDHHDHEHEEQKSKPVISRKWQVATVAGNALIGAAELAVGGGSTLSVTTDGIHNAGDAGTYYLQTENVLNPKLNENKIKRRRKIAHAIIAGLSLSAAVKAGYDIQFSDETVHNPTTIYAAGASLALNSLLMATLYRGINRKKLEGTLGPHEKDLTKHLWAIDVPSAAIAVGGAVAQRYGIDDVESIGAVASGVLGAYAFRPTAKNLEHNNCAKHGDHAGHGHGHGHHDQENEALVIPFTPRRKGPRIARAATAFGVAAALGVGVTSAGILSNESESSEKSAHAAATLHVPEVPSEGRIQFAPPPQAQEDRLFVVSPPVTVFEQVQKGNTQWGMVEEDVHEAGRTVDRALVNVLTDLTAHGNQAIAPNPDRISVGQTLEMPSKQVIDLVDETLDNPASDLTLFQDLQELNETDEMPKEEKIKKKRQLIGKMKNHIKTKLQKVKMLLAS